MIATTTVHEVGASIRRLLAGAEQCRRHHGEHLGLRGTELTALDHLFQAGPLQPRDLSDRLRLSPGATTALIDRLQAAGLVVRAQHPVDRRSVVVSLTPAGGRAMAAVTESTQRALHDRLDLLKTTHGVTDDDIARFIGLASELGEALAAAELPGYPQMERQVG